MRPVPPTFIDNLVRHYFVVRGSHYVALISLSTSSNATGWDERDCCVHTRTFMVWRILCHICEFNRHYGYCPNLLMLGVEVKVPDIEVDVGDATNEKFA